MARSGNDGGPKAESLTSSSSRAHHRAYGNNDDSYGGLRRQADLYPYPEQRNFNMQHSSSSAKVGPDSFSREPDANVITSKPKKGVAQILRRYADKCSMQGPTYIHGSTWWLSRSIWVLMLLAAMGFMTFHLYYLFQTYFDYPVKNTITLGFSSLQFPAITVCNVNPVRASQQHRLSDDFARLVSMVDPDTLAKKIKAGLKEDPKDDDEDEHEFDDVDFGLTNFTDSDGKEELSDGDLSDLEGFGNSWESEGKTSSFAKLTQKFTDVFATETRSKRIAAGHNIRTMLVECSFSGKSCSARNFTLHTSIKYGNCYTLQYEKFISRLSGPDGGLELLFYVERDQYLRGFTHSHGLQVVVHPQNTAIDPKDDGMAASAGTHTMMALRLINIERKGHPYGDCISTDTYKEKYGLLYTRKECQRFCLQEHVHNECQCRDERAEELNIIMNATQLRPCRNKAQVKCLHRVIWKNNENSIDCNCHNPCSEQLYERTASFRPWPTEDYAKGVLVTTACRRVTDERCRALKNSSGPELSHDFVKLNIYFEDLNYENITEEPDYEDVQFISDVGGTLGLWIGLSVLGFVEVIQLALELCRFAFCRCWKRSEQ